MLQSEREKATLAFYQWEYKGRGHYHFPFCVDIEPPFTPFFRNKTHCYPIGYDDGKSPSFFKQIQSLFLPEKKEEKPQTEDIIPNSIDEYSPLVSLKISFSKPQFIDKNIFIEILNMLSDTDVPVAFEIVGTGEKITLQCTCSESDELRMSSLFNAYLPNILIEKNNPFDFPFNQHDEIALCDFGLEEEFMRTINIPHNFTIDPLTSLLGTLENLYRDDTIIFQVLFKGVKNAWAKNILNAVTDNQGGSFFIDAPEMLHTAKQKVSHPLFAVVMRMATQSKSTYRTQFLASEVINSIRVISTSEFNRLIPLSNEGYEFENHILNLYHRQSNRLGMILNTQELVSFVHFPNETVHSKKLGYFDAKNKSAPSICLSGRYMVGVNGHQHNQLPVFLNDEQRLRHTHIIGTTGVGKSTLMANMILEDINVGNGCALFDPHGDIVEDVLARIPDTRKQDVIVIDPSDTEYSIGFNLLNAHTEIEKMVLSSDLVSAFKRHATAWGDNMTAVLSQAVQTFLESSEGGTLIELKRFLLEDTFRNQFLETVADKSIHYYWHHEYPMMRKGIAPLLTRIDTFLRPKILRYMMAQKSGMNFTSCIEEKKILLIKLSQGLIGEDNSYLLGSLFLAKLNQVAQGRQAIHKEYRKPYYIYLDEFQHFITPSITSILSGARKYGFGLILAHQELAQLEDPRILNSVISNPYIRICFRLGDTDAKKLENGFSFFEARDFQTLDTGEALVRVGSSDNDFNITTSPLPEIDIAGSQSIKEYIIDNTRLNYSQPVSEIQKILNHIIPDIGNTNKKIHSSEKKKPLPTILVDKDEDKTIIESKNVHTETHKQEYLKKVEVQETIGKHRALQKYVKALAIQRDFKASFEEETPSGGRVDISLIKDDIQIAIEISVTNTLQYEVQNIQKCIDAGYTYIYMISENPVHLKNIKQRALESIEKRHHNLIQFFSPSELPSYLDSINVKKMPKTKSIRGYRVKSHHVDINPTQAEEKGKTIRDIILTSMKKDKENKG